MLRNFLDHEHQECGERFRTSDYDLAPGWIGNELDIANALSQFIERSPATYGERLSIRRRNHPFWRAVQKPNAKRVLEVGNHLRHRWCGNPEPRGSLGHATEIQHSKEHMEIAESQPPANLAFPINPWRH